MDKRRQTHPRYLQNKIVMILRCFVELFLVFGGVIGHAAKVEIPTLKSGHFLMVSTLQKFHNTPLQFQGVSLNIVSCLKAKQAVVYQCVFYPYLLVQLMFI